MSRRTLRAGVWLALLLVSCGTPARRKAPDAGDAAGSAPAPPPPAEALAFKGEVVRANLADGYVIVKCAFLPSAGGTYTVFRGFHRVASIRFTGNARRPFAAADIVDGTPRAGDRVQE
jgi:hypothetical protein